MARLVEADSRRPSVSARLSGFNPRNAAGARRLAAGERVHPPGARAYPAAGGLHETLRVVSSGRIQRRLDLPRGISGKGFRHADIAWHLSDLPCEGKGRGGGGAAAK